MAPSPLSSPQLKDQITQRVFIHELPAAIAKSEWETDSLLGVNSSSECDCVHACTHFNELKISVGSMVLA